MPSIVTPSFVYDLESRMRHITETEYLELASKLWWNQCTKVMTTGGRREIVTWVLNTAQIESEDDGGNISFDDMMIMETEFSPSVAGKGLRLRRQQFDDLDGNGVNLAAEWSAQIGAQQAYWPQKQVVTMLKNGAAADALAYDGLPFFSASHKVNPKDAAKGTFANLFTGVRIDTGVTADVALTNLQTVFGKIAAIKAPNGNDPRFLRPKAILANPLLYPRAVQLTSAKFIAQAAATGGGGADVEALITALGYGTPTLVPAEVSIASSTGSA